MNAAPRDVARGVYVLPWTGPAGEVLLSAVNRYGRRVLDAAVPPEQEDDGTLALWDFLDRVDPIRPPLAVVR